MLVQELGCHNHVSELLEKEGDFLPTQSAVEGGLRVFIVSV